MLMGIAELSSAFPLSGVSCLRTESERSTGTLHKGQYHFTYIVAPDNHKAFAAYILGAINAIAW